MNEHDELRDQAARIAYEIEVQNYGGYDWERAKDGVVDDFGVPADELDMAYEIADGIIALVEADVARRLLSDEAVEAAAKALWDYRRMNTPWEPWEELREDSPSDSAVESKSYYRNMALAAIGLTVEDDQP